MVTTVVTGVKAIVMDAMTVGGEITTVVTTGVSVMMLVRAETTGTGGETTGTAEVIVAKWTVLETATITITASVAGAFAVLGRTLDETPIGTITGTTIATATAIITGGPELRAKRTRAASPAPIPRRRTDRTTITSLAQTAAPK